MAQKKMQKMKKVKKKKKWKKRKKNKNKKNKKKGLIGCLISAEKCKKRTKLAVHLTRKNNLCTSKVSAILKNIKNQNIQIQTPSQSGVRTGFKTRDW